MAYRAEIEIGVKGTERLRSLRKNVDELAKRIQDLDGLADVFDAPIQSVKNYEATLRTTVNALRLVETATDDETEAIQKHVQAMGEANAVRDRQNKLIKDQVRAQNEAKAAAIAERTGAKTQYGSPIGPASAQEMDAVYASINKLQQRAIDQANNFTEAIGRGTQEVYDLQAAAAQVQGPKLPVGFDAERKAAEVRTRVAEDQSIKEINARRRVVREVLSEQVNADLKAAQQRLKSNDEVFKDRIAKDNEYGRGWLSRLNERTQESKKANKEVSDQQRKLDAKNRRRRDAFSSAGIGFAFPLLFGQGAGAAVGGGVGGFAGGLAGGQAGFALSLIGTQIGAVVDSLIGGAAELGQALNPLTADIGKIAQAAGFAGTETESYIKAIEANAGQQAALKAATQELAAVVGADGVEALKEFGQASADLGNAFNKLVIQMQSGIAAALAGVTEAVAEALEDIAALNVGRGRTEGRFGEINKRIRELTPTAEIGSGQKQVDAATEINSLNAELIQLVKEEERLRQKNLARTKELQDTLRGIKDQQAQVQTQLEILDITEKATASTTQAADIRKQAAEFVARQEEQIASIRLGLERQISSTRLQNLSKEAQLRNTQDKLELARLRNRLTQASQNFAASIKLDQPGRDFAISLNKAAADFNLALAKANSDRAANDRSNALELEQLGVRAEQTKANVRRQVAKLQANFEKQSAELNQKVADYNNKVSIKRFNLEKEITKLRLTTLEGELALERLKLENADKISEKQKKTFKNIQDGIEKARLAVNRQATPEALGSLNLGSPGGVSTEGFDAVIKESETLIQRLSEAKGQLIDEKLVTATQEFTNSIDQSTQALVQQTTPLDNRLKTMERTAEVARLVAEGFSQADATAIVEGTTAFAKLDEQLNFARENLKSLLNGFLALEDQSPEIAEAIQTIQEALGKVDKKIQGNTKGVQDFVDSFDKTNKIKDYLDQLKDELGDTQGMIVSLAQTIEGEIGSAMSTAITNVITGAGTVEEAMSTMFANIGKAFFDMATQMIAKALIMKALGILSGGGGGSFMGAAASPGGSAGVAGIGGSGFVSPFRATGGPTRPNGTYLVGEQGPELLSMGNQPGYVHRNTSEAMDRYRGGGGSGSGAAGNLNINYNVTDINGMRFVTEDQFRTGMTQAARDGAARGEASTFRTLRNSRSSRSRVGL